MITRYAVMALLVATGLTPEFVTAQSPAAVPDIPAIMRGPEFVGREPTDVRWSADSRWLYFQWLPPGADWRAQLRPYRIRAVAGAVPESLGVKALDTLGPLAAEGPLSPDRSSRVVSWAGDLYLVPLGNGRPRRLTDTPESESDPAFTADGRAVTFRRDLNGYRLSLVEGQVRQLTNIRSGAAPSEDSTTLAQRKALEADQRFLFQVIRDRLHADSLRKAEQAERDSLRTLPFYLGKDRELQSLSLSPAGTGAVVVVSATGEKPRRTEVPTWVTRSGYVEQESARENVGDVQERLRAAFIALPSGKVTWLDPIPGDTTGVAASLAVLGWTRDGTRALLHTITTDYKWRYLYAVNGTDGALTKLEALHDTAWIDGPCLYCGGWLADGRAWYVSEADGFAHLYTVGADGNDRRQLTSGSWEVLDAALLPDGRRFLLHTSEGSPFERHAWLVPAAGGPRVRLTSAVGGHDVTLSPDGKLLADVYSKSNRPPELFIQPAQAGAKAVQLTTSPTAEWLAGPWIDPEIIRIPASDGVGVPARIYRPADLGARPNGAAVIFVHGAGYLHNVLRYWSDYYREYMFHHLLASRGYVVLDLDYRGSAGYGRDWRVAIYRHMGGRDLQDEVDASRWLSDSLGIPAKRIGIYGGSYGGFMTLMALFTAGERFGAGAALRSVTDWAHYNHWYTSRILNLPQDDTLAYRQSSPIYFAGGLSDPLLIAHGMVDTNVEFQDVVRLSQRLIELGKHDWELAVYPVENHGFVRPDSWTDEYTRILALFDRVLLR
jgi:dipeptidyl aminopeptidase/acylaminoacyl peptidase